MQIAFPIDQIIEWEQRRQGSSGYEMMRCIQMLGGPVIAGDGNALILADNASYFRDQATGAIHWKWDENAIPVFTPKISSEARDAILMLGKDSIAFPTPSDQ